MTAGAGGSPPTVAQALAAGLRELGVERAFGVSGGAISVFWSALAGAGIAVTHFRHESGAGFAACEAGLAAGAPVVVFVTSGPGLTNVLTSMYAARHEGARVVLVSARTDDAMAGRRPLQETGPRTIPHEGIFTAGPFFDHAAVLTDPARLPELLQELARGLAGPRGFVAHVSFSLAVQRAVASGHPAPLRVVPASSRGAAHNDALRVHDVLRERSWVLWVGSGARCAPAPVRRLARAAAVPVMATPRAKGIFPEDDPAYLGVTGISGHRSVQSHLERDRPDHVLVVGSSLGDFASGYSHAYVPRSSFIHVDIDPAVPGAAYPEATTMPVLCDAGELCEALADLFASDGASRDASRVSPPFEPTPPAARRASGPIDPRDLMDAVQAVFVEAGIPVMAESGNSLAWAANRLRFTRPRQWRTCSGLVASMGHFASGVVGAALASGRHAVAIVGDGAMLMANELSTAVYEGAPAVWIVLNDARYNMCAQGMSALGLANVDCGMPATDFAALAEAMGAPGIVVSHPSDLHSHLAATLEHDGPIVVDVRIDPAPLAPTEGRNAGLARSMRESQ